MSNKVKSAYLDIFLIIIHYYYNTTPKSKF